MQQKPTWTIFYLRRFSGLLLQFPTVVAANPNKNDNQNRYPDNGMNFRQIQNQRKPGMLNQCVMHEHWIQTIRPARQLIIQRRVGHQAANHKQRVFSKLCLSCRRRLHGTCHQALIVFQQKDFIGSVLPRPIGTMHLLVTRRFNKQNVNIGSIKR